MAAIKNVTGNTTVIAEIAKGPIHLPTKIVSTIMLRDITKIPIDAGTACFINKLLIESIPKVDDFLFNVFLFFLDMAFKLSQYQYLQLAIPQSN
ncbi:hypothetical protein ULMS_02870 [Patiriisocius marinistellae]|uniref:Uncharacterized protein n=1 Tax=Patiriisocius marinistellae TaxID=2494560 RepID=A0A5J4FXG3_9FLAO|nr:hypothetical protein ULMS_02870 [Patiriisocius marinistellae]